jgi:hypothetical protein
MDPETVATHAKNIDISGSILKESFVFDKCMVFPRRCSSHGSSLLLPDIGKSFEKEIKILIAINHLSEQFSDTAKE